jgi:hypothetical protein
MDRLESLNIEPWSAPGLVPGVLGVLMLVFGLALALSPARVDSDPPARIAWGKLAGILGLTGIFVFGALGRVPFTIAAAVVMFVWMLTLSWNVSPATRPRLLLRTAIIASMAALVIAHLFQDVFLVRLP